MYFTVIDHLVGTQIPIAGEDHDDWYTGPLLPVYQFHIICYMKQMCDTSEKLMNYCFRSLKGGN